MTGDQSHNSAFALDALIASRYRPALTRDKPNQAQITVSDYLHRAGETEQLPNRDSITGIASAGFTNPGCIYQMLRVA